MFEYKQMKYDWYRIIRKYKLNNSSWFLILFKRSLRYWMV